MVLRIKQHRLKKGLTQSDLASLTGNSVNYIAMVERGERDPSLKFLGIVATALNVSQTDLLEYEAVGDLPEKAALALKGMEDDPERAAIAFAICEAIADLDKQQLRSTLDFARFVKGK